MRFSNTHAQSPSPFISDISIELKQISGIVYPHHSFISYVINDFQHGFEIQARTKTYGRSNYDYYYRFPSLGIGYQNISIGNIEKLGRASLLFALIDVPIYKANNYCLGYQGNFGSAIAHKPLSESTYNTLLSSRFNYFIGFDIFSEYSWKNANTIRLSTELSHISNGKIKTPNIGINSFQISLAYSRKLYENKSIKPNLDKINIPKTHFINIGAFGGLKADDYLSDTLYPTSTLMCDYEYHCSPKYSFSAGLDMFYDNTLRLFKPEFQTLSNHFSIVDLGIHSGVYIHYSHMCFIVQAGRYLISNNKKTDYYARTAIRYNWNKYFINLGLKSHKTTADFLEIGGGIRILCKEN